MSDLFDGIMPDIGSRYQTGDTTSAQKTTNDWLLPDEKEKSTKSNTDLSFEDMLMLMVTQLQNQTIDNQADTNDMMNQLIQMTVMQALTEMSTQVEDLTNANIMSYSASLVGKEVTVGVLDEKGLLAEEVVGTVTATGTYNGEQVIFMGDKYYPLSNIMAVGTLPEKAVDGTDTKPAASPDDPAEGGDTGGVTGGDQPTEETGGADEQEPQLPSDESEGGTEAAGSEIGTEGV